MLAALLLWQGAAWAGRRPFLYAHDVAMVPEGDVELETWFDYVNQKAQVLPGMENPDLWRFWWGPRWSPVDGVEITALISLQQNEDPGVGPDGMPKDPIAAFWAGLLEARWRSTPKPFGSLMLQLDLRLGFDPDLPHQIQPQVGWVRRGGRFVETLQVGYAKGFGHADYDWLTWRAGVAVDVIRGEISAPLQIGIESFGELMLTNTSANDFHTGRNSAGLVGPTVSVARGRLWFTGGVLFGVSDQSPSAYVRGIIGLAL
jgi:hypothetical protein